MSSIQRHNVSIPVVLTATGTFTANLSCPFVPDEIKVKNLAFVSLDAGTTAVFTIQVAGFGAGGNPGGNVLGTVVNPCTTFSGITIPTPNFTAGTYTFGVYEDFTPSTALAGASLNIILEFRRYLH